MNRKQRRDQLRQMPGGFRAYKRLRKMNPEALQRAVGSDLTASDEKAMVSVEEDN